MYAFALGDGYYQTTEQSPAWAVGMTSVAVVPADVPDPKEAIRSEILNLELTQLLPRATREFMLLAMEAQAPAAVLALNPGYSAVKAFDTQIAALRAML